MVWTGELIGSPPHARGKGGCFAGGVIPQRITPARAGKSKKNHTKFTAGRDHPRTRGEKSPTVAALSTKLGSPPHARGKGKPPDYDMKGMRITPARAGKSTRVTIRFAFCRDHPRTRGEKVLAFLVNRLRQGSPPHARGKGLRLKREGQVMGITPARAGKSQRLQLGGVVHQDHPRTRGEKVPASCDILPFPGSPPHARGKADQTAADQRRGQDHPRTRGEKPPSRCPRWNTRGSPPHARGKVFQTRHHVINVGITPARAGKSKSGWSRKGSFEDHPRTRGEK